MDGEAIWHLLLLLLLGTAVVQGLVLVAVMRQVGTILLQIRPPAPGLMEDGPTVGTTLELPDSEISGPLVVLFVTPNCAPCGKVVPIVPIVARNYPAIEFIGVITGPDESQRLAYADELEGIDVRPDLHFLEERWRIPGTPYAVGLDEQGRVVQAGVVNHLDHLESLCESLLSEETPSWETSSNGGSGSAEVEIVSPR
jgi:thiol-disulfide isomerase/thioredoxin